MSFHRTKSFFFFNSIVIYLFLGAAALYHVINQPTCSQTLGMHKESSKEAQAKLGPLLVGPGIAVTGRKALWGGGRAVSPGSSLPPHTSSCRSHWEREKEGYFVTLLQSPVLSRQKNGA